MELLNAHSASRGIDEINSRPLACSVIEFNQIFNYEINISMVRPTHDKTAD